MQQNPHVDVAVFTSPTFGHFDTCKMWTQLTLVALLALVCQAVKQVRDTKLSGTWSTGSGSVTTGPVSCC